MGLLQFAEPTTNVGEAYQMTTDPNDTGGAKHLTASSTVIRTERTAHDV